MVNIRGYIDGAPTTTRALSPSALATSSPALGSIALVQKQILGPAIAIAVPSPTLGAPAPVQNQVLGPAIAIAVSPPTLGSIALAQNQVLGPATAIAVPSPALGSITLVQKQVLGPATAIAVPSPTLGLPTFTQKQVLGPAVAKVVSSPILGAPAFTSGSTVDTSEADMLLRSAFPTTTTTQNSYVMSGYVINGDYGAGAIYTRTGAVSTGPMAIQDAAGVWFNLVVVDGVVNAKHFGAKGDGSVDDYAALQAAINFVMSKGVELKIPAGYYASSAELVVGGTGGGSAIRDGITISGAGNAYIQGAGATNGGTVIVYTGAPGAASIIRINTDAYMNFSLRDMCLYADRPTTISGSGWSAANVARAIYIPDTKVSNCIFRNLALVGTTDGIFLTNGSGGVNGEDFLFDNVWGYSVDNFYHNTDSNGQTYNHTFVNCGASIYPGGTYFLHCGSGLAIFGFSATGMSQGRIWAGLFGTDLTKNWVSNTTFLKEVSNGNNAPVVVHGGRIEALTRLYTVTTADWQLKTTVVIDGLQCILDNTPTSGANVNTLNGFINMQRPDMLSIRSCTFDCQNIVNGVYPIFDIVDNTPSDQWDWLLKFRECNFNRHQTHPKLLASPKVQFEDCQYQKQNWVSDQWVRFTSKPPQPTGWNYLLDAGANVVLDDYLGAPNTARANTANSANQVRSTTVVDANTRVVFAFTVVAGASATNIVGIASASHSFATDIGGSAGFSVGYSTDGSVTCGATVLLAANAATQLAVGDTGVMALDLFNLRCWVRKAPSGNWNNSGTADPATGVGGLPITTLKSPPFFIAAQMKSLNGSVTALPAYATIPGGGFSNWASVSRAPN